MGILPAQVERTIYNATRGPFSCCYFGCLKVMGLWGSDGQWPVVSSGAARILVRGRHRSQGDGASGHQCCNLGTSVGKAWSVGQVRQHGSGALSGIWGSQRPHLCCLHFVTATHQIGIEAKHEPGVHNTAADTLSRNMMQTFLDTTPQAQEEATWVSPPLLDMLLHQCPDWISPSWRKMDRH